MAWFNKKPDPISDRARALNEEIAALEAQIQQLSEQKENAPPPAKLRSTAIPHGETIQRPEDVDTRISTAAARRNEAEKAEAPKPHEPIFEEVDQNRLKSQSEVATPDHYNDLGVRKYDLPALLKRLRNHFRGPSTTNPKLVHYLAAGGVQGLRPLRYEKRVARNRFLAFAIVLFFVLLGVLLAFVKTHR